MYGKKLTTHKPSYAQARMQEEYPKFTLWYKIEESDNPEDTKTTF